MAAARKFRTGAADAGRPLGPWLAERLGVAEAEARALVEAGAVYVDGRRRRDPAEPLAAGQAVTAHAAAAAAPTGWRVVHEDAEVVVVDKPAGLPSQATREAAGALDEQVAARFPDARLLHRIDRETSGLVLFARAPARTRLQRALEDGAILREYAAVVAGAPARDAFTLDAPIGRDPADPRRRKARVAGGERARTRVVVARRGADVALLAVRLETGRTHQIRVHLADAGHPILGDPLYAPPEVRARAPRLALHARRLLWPGGAAESPLPAELVALLGLA